MGQLKSKLGGKRQAKTSNLQPQNHVVHTVTETSSHDDIEQMHNQITALEAEFKWSEAVQVAQDALELSKTRLGMKHTLTRSSMYMLGGALHGDGRIWKALQTFQELLPLYENDCGPYHRQTFIVHEAICEELCNMGKYEEAQRQLLRLAARGKLGLSLEHERTIKAMNDLAHVLQLLGRNDDARELWNATLRTSMAALGPRSVITLAIRHDLIRLRDPLIPDIDETKTMLCRHGLSVSDKPFAKTTSLSIADLIGDSRWSGSTTAGYEAANGIMLQAGRVNGVKGAKAPVSIPPDIRQRGDGGGESKLAPISTARDGSFQSLIQRSIDILPENSTDLPLDTRDAIDRHTAFLQRVKSIDDVLTAEDNPVWFFQHKTSFLEQSTFQKWASNALDRYVLVPTEGGLANPQDCVFVSHYWRSPSHSDPDGDDLRQIKQLLEAGYWSKAKYFWVDWTCLPQEDRTVAQKQYFGRLLPTIPKLVRHCTFAAQLPHFSPRLWVLFEIAAYTFSRAVTPILPGTQKFRKHLLQMQGNGVKSVLDIHGYTCANIDDRELVTVWLQILIALQKGVPSVHVRRQILDAIDNPEVIRCAHEEAGVQIDKERGWMKIGGTTHQFNPFQPDEAISDSPKIMITIDGDSEKRLEEAQNRADASFNAFGVLEIGRDYDRAGDYKIGEALYRRALKADGTSAAAFLYLVKNLQKQNRFTEALELCRDNNDQSRRLLDSYNWRLGVLEEQEHHFRLYQEWKSKSAEECLFNMCPLPNVDHEEEPPIRHGLRRSWLQTTDWMAFGCIDCREMTSKEVMALEEEREGKLTESLRIHIRLLQERRANLGPCHAETRRSLRLVARQYLLRSDYRNARVVYMRALAVCDFTVGRTHPESTALLGNIAETFLGEGTLWGAREYYRRQLERVLAFAEWDDPEAYLSKLCLESVIKGFGGLKISGGGEETKVEIV